MVVAVVSGAVALAVCVFMRSRSLSAARRADAVAPPRTLGADGVIVGAGAFRLDAASDRSVLVIHGFNDTPQSVAAFARALHARGWNVSVPRLPHHGRIDNENAQHSDATEWIEHVRTEWRALRSHTPRAVLAGQSMGGAIAAILAAESAPVALVLLAPYLEMGRWPRIAAAFWRVSTIVMPVILSDPQRGLRDPSARAQSLGRGQFTPRLLNQLRRVVNLARPVLPRLRMPTLVVQGRMDYRIPTASAQRVFDRLGAPDKTLVWLADVGHVVAADKGTTNVGALVGEWLDARVPRGS